jgi:L-asparaginase II
MEDLTNLPSDQIYCLPNGQRVVIESCEGDPPTALVRRIDGPFEGMLAVCAVSSLKLAEENLS